MEKLFVAVLCIFALFAACKKEAAKEVSATVSAAPVEVALISKSSDKYRENFNKAAGSMYGFQWVKDEGGPNKINMEDGELYIPQALYAKFGLSDGNVVLTPELSEAITNVEEVVNMKRRDSVTKTLLSQKEVHFWFDIKQLSEPYQKAAKYLVEASHWLHELYKLQLDPNAAATEAKVYKDGDTESIRLFERNAGASCGRYGDKDNCAVLPDYSEPAAGAIMWPEDMNDKAFEEIKAKAADPADDPLLSPFTVVKRGEDGALKAIPYAKYPPFQKYMEKIASLMEQAADVHGLDATFASQLKLQAASFRSDDPRPYFKSDEAWGASKGELEFTVGPYETYQDPYGTKAFFESVLGMEDKEATEVVGKFMPLLPHIEQMFALAVGTEIYQPKTITGIPPLRVVRVITGDGETRKSGGPAIAFSLPNIGPMANEGRTKRLIMANHHEAKFEILKAIAEIALTPEQLTDVDARSFVFDSTFHEIMHGIGPPREWKVGDTTMALALGDYYDSLEEAKANVGGVWAAKFLLDNGIITADELRKIHTTYVAGLMRIMRFGAKEAHARGAALEFSYLYSKGAIEDRGERFFIVHEKMQDALNGIVADIGRAQAKGDKALTKVLLEDYPAKAPGLLEVLAKKFAAAGIPRDVALVYHVTGM